METPRPKTRVRNGILTATKRQLEEGRRRKRKAIKDLRYLPKKNTELSFEDGVSSVP